VVISVRIREEVKRVLEEAGINISEAVREYLEELAWRIRVRKTIEKWDKMLEGVKPSEKGFAARSVREDRDSH
jgi:antitoxin component of RelBE/YafQ-DinJ toxin-antitoxin module